MYYKRKGINREKLKYNKRINILKLQVVVYFNAVFLTIKHDFFDQ